MIVSCGLLVCEFANADCSAVVRDAYAWASKRDAHTQYRVDFLISNVKAAAKSVHYSQGSLTLTQDGVLSSEQTSTVSSDHAWCPNNSGPFCVPYQKFDYRKSEPITFRLQNNGVLKVVLHNKGRTAYSVNLQCSGAFLYGASSEPNGSSFLTMSLSKASSEITSSRTQ